MTAAEAQSIDKKLDDGIANTGQIESVRGRLLWADQTAETNNCSSGTYLLGGTPGSDYFLSDSGPDCFILMGLGISK